MSLPIHAKIGDLERNFNEVQARLSEELEKNTLLKERLDSLQEEKDNSDVRCTELKQALEEFIYSTDKRGEKENDEQPASTEEEPVDTGLGKVKLKSR